VPHLQNEAKNCDNLVLWLDNDREGENICFEVLDVVGAKLRKGARIYRAHFSSITAQDLRLAYAAIRDPPNEN
jgi:DNA topoisomerase-3